MSDLLVYAKPVLLDRHRHRTLRVRIDGGFAFAREANALLLAGTEFNEAYKEYGIVFTRVAGQVMPVAMLGLRDRENLFVEADGRWDARYVPAFVRRYPFVPAQMEGEALAACIDEACPGLGDPAGEPLFDAQGQDTPFLRQATDFLALYQREVGRTEAFCRRLEQSGLLVPMNAKADLVDGSSFTVDGLLVIDEQKLMALPDAQALALFRSGELHLASMHLASLSNLQRLVDRLGVRRATAAQPA